MTRLKAGPSGVELEWGEQLDEAEKEVAGTIRDAHGETASEVNTDPVAQDFFTLAQSHPSAAVLMSFQRIEAELAAVLREWELLPSRRRTMRAMLDLARGEGLISSEIEGAASSLRNLRNEVSHATTETEVTVGRATQYVIIANEVVKALQDARKSS